MPELEKKLGEEDVNFDVDEEILDSIKRVLLERHPIVEDRLDELFEKGEFDISFNIYDREGNITTDIWFLDGKENARSSIPESISLDNRVSLNLINALISYILKDHEIVSSLSTNYRTSIDMTFNVNLREEMKKGINCRTLGLNLNFYGDVDMSKYLELYLKDIITVFFDKVMDTPFMKREVDKYVSTIKEQFLDGSSKDDILALLSKLPNEELCKIIYKMDAYSFMNALKNKEATDIKRNVLNANNCNL